MAVKIHYSAPHALNSYLMYVYDKLRLLCFSFSLDLYFLAERGRLNWLHVHILAHTKHFPSSYIVVLTTD